MSEDKCNCELGLETDKRHPIYPDLCFYCGDQSPKFKDLKRLVMTDKPKESAENIVESCKWEDSESGKQGINEDLLVAKIKSYAKQEAKQACKEKEDEFFAELCVMSIKDGKEQQEMINKLRESYAPEPQD